MALSDKKITTGDFTGKDVAGLPDQVTGQASMLKRRFDEISKSVITPKFNALIDELAGSGGAAAIGTAQDLGLDRAVLSENVDQIRRTAEGKLELKSDGQWNTPPTGHIICNTHGQATRQTDRLQFVGADVSVVNDTTVVEITASSGGEGGTGQSGRDGENGQDGKSAYDLAVEGGYTGTLEAFSAQLANIGSQSAGVAALMGSNLLLNSNLRSPVNVAGAASYTGAQESITGWRIRSPGGAAQVTMPLTSGYTGFISGAAGDELVQIRKGLGFLAGKTAVFSLSAAPLAGASFKLFIRTYDANGITQGYAESATYTVPVFNSGTFVTASVSLAVDAAFNNSSTLEVAVQALGSGRTYQLSWAKLEMGGSPTEYVTPSPLMEQAAALTNPAMVYGSYTGNGATAGQTVELGFSPSVVLVMVSGTDFFQAVSSYMTNVSGHFAMAFRGLPYVGYDQESKIEIVTGGFLAVSGSKSYFNTKDKVIRYIALR